MVDSDPDSDDAANAPVSASAESEALLSPRLAARLTSFALATRRPLTGGLIGEHRSPRHGSSLDFSDYREYHPGDDLRRVDMNAFARLDRLLLKLFEAEDDVAVRLLIDTSASMAGAKLLSAKRFAAAIGLVALTDRDTVSLHAFPTAGRRSSAAPRFLGPSGFAALQRSLSGLVAEGATPFVAATLDLLARPGPPGLTVVISDLLTSEWEQAIRRLPARRGDLVVIQVLDRADVDPASDPEFGGDLQLVDAETGATVDVSISPSVAADYAELAGRWLDEVAARVRRVGGGYVQTFTDEDFETTALAAITGAGVVR